MDGPCGVPKYISAPELVIPPLLPPPLTTTMEEPQNLRSLFEVAKAEKTSLESRADTNTDHYRSEVDSTITKFEECQRVVSLLSLFSSNESLEDIATADLQYCFITRFTSKLADCI